MPSKISGEFFESYRIMRSMIRPAELARSLGVSRRQLYVLIRAGKFPCPMKVSRCRTFWLREDIAGFIEAKRLGL